MARRKQTEPLKFAFIAFQGFAAVLLFGVIIQYISAKTTFGGKEFIPVEITYTGCESYETKDFDDDNHVEIVTRYRWYYVYIVDGVQYEGQYSDMSHSVTPGDKVQRYYDPDNPQKLSGYQSFKDQMKDSRAVLVVFWILEILAVVFLILSKRKELERRQKDKQEEAFIRQDIQKNREIYDKLDIVINAEQTFSVLEPTRKNIYSTQKKLNNLRKSGVAVAGNPILLVVSIIVNAVRAYRIGKLENKLGEYRTSFYTEYRRSIAEPVLRNCFESYRYLPEQGFSSKELKDFQLFTVVDRVHTEDYIEGNYKNVGYRQSDVIIEHYMEDTYRTIFSGRLAVYDFKKNLTGQIAIVEKGYSNASLTGMQKVQMENMAFNQRFHVYATNAHVAFYLLTPQFMEYIMELNTRGELYIRFAANKVFLLRNHVTGVFQPDMRATMDIQYEIGKSYNEIKEILNFIDILNLDKVADEANLRAAYSDDMDNYEGSVQEEVEEPKFGVVDEEDSIFGGPSFAEPELKPDEEPLFHEPDANKLSVSGLKLKL